MRTKDERTAFMAEAERIKSLGFDVYVVKDPEWCYGYFVEGGSFAYFQLGSFGGLEVSTCHKPCKNWGSGFGVDVGISPTKHSLRRAFLTPTGWGGRRVSVTKYANFDEYINNHKYSELVKL